MNKELKMSSAAKLNGGGPQNGRGKKQFSPLRLPQAESRIGLDAKSAISRRKSYWTLGFSLSVLPLLARAERAYRTMPQLREQARPTVLPPLSIIVPARNEAHNLRRLLPSLLEQDYAGEMEIIVVDDHSTDDTADVVMCEIQAAGISDRMHGGRAGRNNNGRPQKTLRLIRATELPAGWLGKPHASHLGALAARGDWLLFTDADMVHKAASAASAVAFAETHGLDGLSLFPQQETRGLVDSAVLMVAFAGLFAGLRRSTSMLNGQYVLVRRDVYEESGGFAAVCSEMMDDLAYGSLMAERGYRTPIMRGESLAAVHMYDDWRQMWHGINRLGSGSLRYNGLMALIPAIFITGVMMPLWTLLFNRHYIREIPRLRLIWLTAVLGFLPWAKRFNDQQRPAASRQAATVLRALLAPAAAFFVQLSALWGMVSRLAGRGVSWKERKV